MRKSFLSLLLLVLTPLTVSAHSDMVLSMRKDGVIPEVPAQFGQARLIASGLGSANPQITLRIGAHQTRLFACLTHLIHSQSPADILITSSWYHDTSILPYYIVITFRDPGWNAESHFNSGYEFLFNLNDAKLLKATRLEAYPDHKGLQLNKLDPSVYCKGSHANMWSNYSLKRTAAELSR